MFERFKKMGRTVKREANRQEGHAEEKNVFRSLAENIAYMKSVFCNDSDFVAREFVIPVSGGIKAALFYIDGLVSNILVNDSVLNPLMIESRKMDHPDSIKLHSIGDITSSFLLAGEISISTEFESAFTACLMGDSVLMVDGFSEIACFNTKGFERRSITEPQTETVVRGPREGFTEVIRINTSLIRRKLKTPHLRMDMMTIGKRTHTLVCLTYLDNIANPNLIKEVKRRLKTIDTDAILNSGYIEEYIEDAPYSFFQTINYTEKPDIVAARLLEGRCALIIDGTPFVLTMPMLFTECFQSAEDYASRSYVSVFLRIIRILSFLISLTVPAVYVALTSFHQELIPTTLLFTIAATSEGLPFTSAVETSIMLITFEILKEAGIRLPKPIGQTVSIVGALVMGQAAVQAGIVGAPVVIVIAFAAVSTFLIPTLSDAITILRWYLLILASIMGGFGITLGFITILFHLASLKSFGSEYLYPFSPFKAQDIKDSVMRVPLWKMRTRPEIFHPQDKVRQQASKPEFGREDTEE